MTFSDQLRTRAAYYLIFAMTLILVAIIAGALSWMYWLPSAAKNGAFDNLHIHYTLHEYWRANGFPLFEKGDGKFGWIFSGLAAALLTMIRVLAQLAILPLLLLRKIRIILALLLLILIINAFVQMAENKTGAYHTPIAAMSKSQIEQVARDSVAAAPEDPNEGIRFLQRQAMLRYVLAQYVYAANDPALTKTNLDAIDKDYMQKSRVNIWRIAIMREWCAANDRPASNEAYNRSVGLLSIAMQRQLARGLAVIAIGTGFLSLIACMLVIILWLRAKRMDSFDPGPSTA